MGANFLLVNAGRDLADKMPAKSCFVNY